MRIMLVVASMNSVICDEITHRRDACPVGDGHVPRGLSDVEVERRPTASVILEEPVRVGTCGPCGVERESRSTERSLGVLFLLVIV